MCLGVGNIMIFNPSKYLIMTRKIEDRLNSLDAEALIIARALEVLKTIPEKYLIQLDINEGILLNLHGTISIEWRPYENSVISIEIGRTGLNGYSIIRSKVVFSSYENNECSSFYLKSLDPIFHKLFNN